MVKQATSYECIITLWVDAIKVVGGCGQGYCFRSSCRTN